MKPIHRLSACSALTISSRLFICALGLFVGLAYLSAAQPSASVQPTDKALANYKAALAAASNTSHPSQARGRAFLDYNNALIDAGMSMEETARTTGPHFRALIELDFHAVFHTARVRPAGMFSRHYKPLLSQPQQDELMRLANQILKKAGPAPLTKPGVGWTAAMRPAATKTAPVASKTAPIAPGPAPVSVSDYNEAEASTTLLLAMAALKNENLDEAFRLGTLVKSQAKKGNNPVLLENVQELRDLIAKDLGAAAKAAMDAKDYPRMIQRLEQAAAMDLGIAALVLGSTYAEGIGVAVNRETARTWYQRALDLGEEDARDALAKLSGEPKFPGQALFERGESAREEGRYEEALSHFKEAAGEGNVAAAHSVGGAYFRGEGTARSHPKAIDWFLLARENVRKHPSEFDTVFLEQIEADLNQIRLIGSITREAREALERGLAHLREQDGAEALAALRESATLGNSDAMRTLGVAYRDGIGTPADFDESRQWFQRAAAIRHAAAINDLAELERNASTHRGKHELNQAYLSEDPVKSVEWLRQAAAKGAVAAWYALGAAYESGKGVSQDQGEAIAHYEKAAPSHADARAALERLALTGPGGSELELARAVMQEKQIWFIALATSAADQGNTFAMVDLARYYESFNVTGNLDRAAEWYRKAGALNHRSAGDALDKLDDDLFAGRRQPTLEERMLDRHSTSDGAPAALTAEDLRQIAQNLARKDAPTALVWLRRAADAGDPSAMLMLANEVQKTDPAAALALVQRAATAGNADAQFQLGMMQLQGRGLPQDQAAGLKLLDAAAEGGSIQARFLYGQALLAGTDGITADHARGLAFLKKAADQKEIPQIAGQAADLLGQFGQQWAQQARQKFETIWANPETRFKELTALYTAAEDKAPIVEFFAGKIVPAWQESTIPNAYKPLRELVSAHYALINTMTGSENEQARWLLYRAVHSARLTAEKSGTKYPDFLYKWIPPGGSL